MYTSKKLKGSLGEIKPQGTMAACDGKAMAACAALVALSTLLVVQGPDPYSGARSARILQSRMFQSNVIPGTDKIIEHRVTTFEESNP